jgi:cellulose synthase operon protein C
LGRLGASSYIPGVEISRTRWLGVVVDWLLVIGTIGIALLPVAAVVAAHGLAVPPSAGSSALASGVAGSGPSVRDVPVFSPGFVADSNMLDDPSAMLAAIDRAAQAAFGSADLAQQFEDVFNSDERIFYFSSEVTGERYPYHYHRLDTMLDATLPQTMTDAQAFLVSDLAGLLIISAGADWDDNAPKIFSQGAGAAFALLHRARLANASCAPQLNLAFVVSIDTRSLDDDISTEFAKAVTACPGDPTPLWLLGQVQTQRVYVDPTEAYEPDLPTGERRAASTADDVARPFATFQRLEQEFPQSAAGWSGEADANLKLAEEAGLHGVQPFTARNRFQRAVSLYEHAISLSDDPDLLVGLARAEAGLGHGLEALAALDRARQKDPQSSAIQAAYIEELERLHRYSDAAAAARALGKSGRDPSGRSLLAQASFGYGVPFSLGASRATPVNAIVGYDVGGKGGALVEDLGFLPDYRPNSAVTGNHGWCPRWTVARDLLLAGQAAQAWTALGVSTDDQTHDLGGVCARNSTPAKPVKFARELFLFSQDQWLLTAVIAASASVTVPHWVERQASVDSTSYTPYGPTDPYGLSASPWQAETFDARQNLWRYAGRLDQAQSVVDEWLRALPGDALGLDRAGEVLFLRSDYAGASRLFMQAADAYGQANDAQRLARSRALLKAGTARRLLGDLSSAQSTLDAAFKLSRVVVDLLPKPGSDTYESSAAPEKYREATLLSYYSLCQAGDAAMANREYPRAVSSYTLAGTYRDALTSTSFDAYDMFGLGKGAEQNNLAIASILSSPSKDSVATATAAAARDPESPIFLQTLGYAYQARGDLSQAALTYERTLEVDPTFFPAENDLGVILSKLGRQDDAVVALRRAVGIQPSYALGWFNLGVVLSGMGPRQFLAAQGAFGQAARFDSHLRDRSPSLIFDEQPYSSGLDLSRPLPPDWQFVRTERRTPATLTIIVVILLLGRLIWHLGLDQIAGAASAKVLDRTRTGFLARLGGPFPPVLAILASLGFLLWPSWASTLDSAVLLVSVGCLIGIFMRSRSYVSRVAGAPVRQSSWLPSIALGGVLTGFGLAFAPLPVVQGSPGRWLVRWLGTLLLGGVTLVLLLLGWRTGVPVTRAASASALVMISSTLVPVKPLDGAYLTNRLANLLVTIALAGVSALLLLNWL